MTPDPMWRRCLDALDVLAQITTSKLNDLTTEAHHVGSESLVRRGALEVVSRGAKTVATVTAPETRALGAKAVTDVASHLRRPPSA